MEEMEHSLERDKPETEITDSTIPNLETIHLAESASPKKSQHADDIALTQCILCMVLVLSVFALHWLKPDWQAFFLAQYTAKRDAPPVAWLDELLRAVQQRITGA